MHSFEMIRIRISDTDNDSSVHLIYHGPSDVGLTDPDPDHLKETLGFC